MKHKHSINDEKSWSIGALLILSMFLIIIFPMPTHAQDDADTDDDMLAYINNDGQLILHNPRTRTETVLLEEVSSFKMGPSGHVAFIKHDKNDKNLYIYDPETLDVMPINIELETDKHIRPLEWSPDGQFLAFATYIDYHADVLYVWNGKTVTSVVPENPLDTSDSFYVDWENNGRMAIMIMHGWSNASIPPEIYMWDGNTTIDVSQNPEGWDWNAQWNQRGELLFGSMIDDIQIFYVWDGVSFKDGTPDKETFIHVAPELQIGTPAWLDDGSLEFMIYTESEKEPHKQIVVWDVETTSIIRQFPITSENYYSSLSSDGQFIISNHLASGIPSYYLDIENMEGEILLSEVVGEISWSSDGYLAYCRRDEERKWILSIWNGEETWDVAQVSYRPVQWQHEENTFSCNNG